MSSNELVDQIMAQVIARVATPEQQAIPENNPPTRETAMAEKSCSLTEFVGTAIGDTVGSVLLSLFIPLPVPPMIGALIMIVMIPIGSSLLISNLPKRI